MGKVASKGPVVSVPSPGTQLGLCPKGPATWHFHVLLSSQLLFPLHPDFSILNPLSSVLFSILCQLQGEEPCENG